jgi:hypothetical protein
MAGVSTLAAVFLAGLLPVQDQDNPLGPKAVNVRNSTFYPAPSRTKGDPIRPAKYGEIVTVTAVVKSYSKVVLEEGLEAYIASSALIARDKFKPEAADEAELGKAKAQGYEAGRFDPETEKKYREQKGPALDAAYKQVDVLEARALIRNRGALEKLLADFRKAGRLGEFGDVK